METHVVIMAGGIGSRLWPISTPQMPKQFIDVLGTGKSLIQMTVDRFSAICPVQNCWVVTSEKYVQTVKNQLPGIPAEQILAEPEARNTAPCIAYACRKIEMRHPGANVVVTPADAIVLEKQRFTTDILKALDCTSKSNAIVTVGIVPTRPETGYGYIHSAGAQHGEINKVSEFKEKPDLKTAETYLADGGYFWNAGIFVWNVKTINDSLKKFAPQITGIMDRLAPSFYTEAENEQLAKLFPLCEKISIDYAVMEKSEDIYVIADDLGWSDLGSWGSIGQHLPTDANGNATVGTDIRLFDCSNCIVHAEGPGTVIVNGLDDYIVSRSGDNMLICKISEEQHIKEFSANPNQNG